jgi:hypothetical protein
LSSIPVPNLFQDSVIGAYVDAPRFLERPWLESRVESALAQPGCRFLLITAEPGAGKSAFIAEMARRHPQWPRYFIRRDQLTPFGNVGVRDFLLTIGLQLAAGYPVAFQRQHLHAVIEQRVGNLEAGAEAVGAQVDRMLASPFYQAVLEINQQVEAAGGKLIGLRVGEWVADPHLIPISDLLAMALIEPGRVLLNLQPDLRLVILVDALDELRYHREGAHFLSWLAALPALPANFSFMLTSRDDPALLSNLRSAQQSGLVELPLSAELPQVQQELQRYAHRLAQEPHLTALLAGESQQLAFVEQAVMRANGNLGFLDALGRALDSALARGDEAGARLLLSLHSVPAGLDALHAHLLRQVWEAVRDERVEMRDPASGETFYLRAWTALYQKILGVLAAAFEPLSLDQIRFLGGLSSLAAELPSALQRLTQFCDLVGGHYRLYHASLAEFLTAEDTRQKPEIQDLYVDAAAWHARIAAFFWPAGVRPIDERLDSYGVNYLARHLFLGRDHRLLQLPDLAWMRRRFEASGHTYAGFLADLDLGLGFPLAAEPDDAGWRDWPVTARLGLLRASLVSLSFQLPPEILLRALELEIWTAERVLDEAARISDLLRRERLFQMLLDSGLLDEAQQDRARAGRQAAAGLQAGSPPETSILDPETARQRLAGRLAGVHRALEAILKIAQRDMQDVVDWQRWQSLFSALKKACAYLQSDDPWVSLELVLGLRPSFQALNPLRERHRLLALAYQWIFDAQFAEKYLDPALELALQQPSPQRELALQALAPFADDSAVSRLLQPALQADPGPLQQGLLASLASRLQASQLTNVLRSTRQIRGDESDQLRALISLMPYLARQPQVYPGALQWALDCAHRMPQRVEAGLEGSQAQALWKLLPSLAEDQQPAVLQEAFQAAGQLSIAANATRLAKAINLASFLPLLAPNDRPPVVSQALDLVDPEKVDEPLFLSPVVAVLAPYLDPERLAAYLEWMPLANPDLRQPALASWRARRQFDPIPLGRAALNAVALIEWDAPLRVQAFTLLLPQLPVSLYEEALEFGLALLDEAARLPALLALLPYLDGRLASRLLEPARALDGLDRVRLQAELASRLGEPFRQQIFAEALKVALSLTDPDQQAQALNALAVAHPAWMLDQRGAVLPCLWPLLKPVDGGGRGAYLRRLSYLAPVWLACLSESGAEDLYHVLDGVCHHWQWE